MMNLSSGRLDSGSGSEDTAMISEFEVLTNSPLSVCSLRREENLDSQGCSEALSRHHGNLDF